MLKFSILNKSVKKKDPGRLNPRLDRGGSIMVKAVSLRKDYPGGFLRKLKIHSPSEHKKAHFLQGQENGKGESLQIQVGFYFASTAPKFAKTPMLYEARILCY